jgi:TfoX/Sxy family transcriptional regulator of competence genes
MKQIKAHLRKYGSITSREALMNYNIFRLAVVIQRLRDQGYIIKTEMITENKKRYAKYHYIK